MGRTRKVGRPTLKSKYMREYMKEYMGKRALSKTMESIPMIEEKEKAEPLEIESIEYLPAKKLPKGKIVKEEIIEEVEYVPAKEMAKG